MANFKSYLYNSLDWYDRGGSFTWTKPADIDTDKPILVHVWGAGGGGADSTPGKGGGGGGLAVKLIDVSALGATETITVGSSALENLQAGTSSFGSHCSASGGNGGTCETSNGGSNGGVDDAANHGVGGIGTGGDVNRRGGTGGNNYYGAAANNGGGGGGSAPAPYGVHDGYNGGDGTTHSGGGGAGIGGNGKSRAYLGGQSGSSMGTANDCKSQTYYTPQPGASGLFGAGGSGGTKYYGFTTNCGESGKNGDQPYADDSSTFMLSPNEIYFGGGSGSTGIRGLRSSGDGNVSAGSGGPGSGGGGSGAMSVAGYVHGGAGGILGGGGGTAGQCRGGCGGNAGGGGASGNSQYDGTNNGGHGLIIVQYARKF